MDDPSSPQDSPCKEPPGFVLWRLQTPIASSFTLPEFRWTASVQATHGRADFLDRSCRIGRSCLIALDGNPFWCVIFGLLVGRK